MQEYYRKVPFYYLKPLRAVLRKAAASAHVATQLPMPEFREQHAEDAAGKGDKLASYTDKLPADKLPVVALPAHIKARLDVLRAEKAKAFVPRYVHVC
jgi:hypothetical protein